MQTLRSSIFWISLSFFFNFNISWQNICETYTCYLNPFSCKVQKRSWALNCSNSSRLPGWSFLDGWLSELLTCFLGPARVLLLLVYFRFRSIPCYGFVASKLLVWHMPGDVVLPFLGVTRQVLVGWCSHSRRWWFCLFVREKRVGLWELRITTELQQQKIKRESSQGNKLCKAKCMEHMNPFHKQFGSNGIRQLQRLLPFLGSNFVEKGSPSSLHPDLGQLCIRALDLHSKSLPWLAWKWSIQHVSACHVSLGYSMLLLLLLASFFMVTMFNVLQKQPDHSALLTQCFSWMSLDVLCLVDLRGLGLCERASCPFCLKRWVWSQSCQIFS